MARDICVFDAYGTLFDVAGAARAAAEDDETLKGVWPQLSAIWREKQIGYSWLRSLAGEHADFWTVTKDGLDYAMAALRLDDSALRERLLELYLELEAYPDAKAALTAIKAMGKRTAILSNGSPNMLESAAAAAGLTGLLDAVLSVEKVRVFKPASQVYEMVETEFNCAERDVLFVSANGWDAAAAAGYGFESVWLNRDGAPMERLPWRPAHVARDLSAVPGLAAR